MTKDAWLLCGTSLGQVGQAHGQGGGACLPGLEARTPSDQQLSFKWQTKWPDSRAFPWPGVSPRGPLSTDWTPPTEAHGVPAGLGSWAIQIPWE